MLPLLCLPIQWAAQWFSFESECQFIAQEVLSENTAWLYEKTYTLAILFELLKAFCIGLGVQQFLKRKTEFIAWTAFGLALSVGSWWMSDQGTSYLAHQAIGSSPINTHTSEISSIYQPQIENIDAEILDLERKNFWWCNLHRTKHTNEECNAQVSGFYINPKERADQLAKAEIAELKLRRKSVEDQMNQELSLASENHQKALGTHQQRLESKHVSLQTKVLISEIIIWVCTLSFSYILFCFYQKTPETDNKKRLYVKHRSVFDENEEDGEDNSSDEIPQSAAGGQRASESGGKGTTLHITKVEEINADGHRIDCETCGKEAILKHPGRFCSKKCRMAWHRARLQEERA